MPHGIAHLLRHCTDAGKTVIPAVHHGVDKQICRKVIRRLLTDGQHRHVQRLLAHVQHIDIRRRTEQDVAAVFLQPAERRRILACRIRNDPFHVKARFAEQLCQREGLRHGGEVDRHRNAADFVKRRPERVFGSGDLPRKIGSRNTERLTEQPVIRSDLVIIKARRQMQMPHAEALCGLRCRRKASRDIGDQQRAFRDLLKGIIGLAAGDVMQRKLRRINQAHQFRTDIRLAVAADDRRRLRIDCTRTQQRVHLHIEPDDRCDCPAHRRRHIAVHKINIGEIRTQKREHRGKIHAGKEVHTADENQHGTRLLPHIRKNIAHALINIPFQTAVDDVVLGNRHPAQTIQRIHFRRGQHNAAQAALRTEIDLMRLRHQHSHVDDIPHAACRRVILQPGREKSRCIRLRDRNDRRIPEKLRRIHSPASVQIRSASAASCRDAAQSGAKVTTG